MQDEPLNTRIPIMMSKSGVQAVDGWRRKLDPIPSRAEAIRRLIEIGLSTVDNIEARRQLEKPLSNHEQSIVKRFLD